MGDATLKGRVCLVSVLSDIGEDCQPHPHATGFLTVLMVDPAVGINLHLKLCGRLIGGEGEDRPADLSLAAK